MAERKDTVTAMGFTGACHPLLNLDELAKEISWGMKNPWGTGIWEVFGVRPSVLIPSLPDLSRPGAFEVYKKYGVQTIGYPSAASLRFTRLQDVRLFPVFRLHARSAGPDDPAVRLLARLVKDNKDVFILLELSGLDSLQPLRFLLENLVFRLLVETNERFTTLGDPQPSTPYTLSPGLDLSAFPAPILRRKFKAAAAQARRKRKRNEDYRRILFSLTPSDLPDDEGEPEERSEPDASLVAQMQGEVMFAGSEFDVRLLGGR